MALPFISIEREREIFYKVPLESMHVRLKAFFSVLAAFDFFFFLFPSILWSCDVKL